MARGDPTEAKDMEQVNSVTSSPQCRRHVPPELLQVKMKDLMTQKDEMMAKTRALQWMKGVLWWSKIAQRT